MDFAVSNFARVLAVGATGLLYGCVTNGGISTASARPASDRVTVFRVMGDIGNPLIEGGHLLRAGRVSEALRLFKQADESGDVLASIAYLYLKGKGVPQDRSRARELLGECEWG
jgi:hypothetical protein